MTQQNVKIYYLFTNNYDESQPNNNYEHSSTAFVFEQDYTIGDYLSNLSIPYKKGIKNEYIVINEDGNETGERYLVYSTELTDEDIRG